MVENVTRRRWLGRLTFVVLGLFIIFTHLIPLETVPPSLGGSTLDPIDAHAAILAGMGNGFGRHHRDHRDLSLHIIDGFSAAGAAGADSDPTYANYSVVSGHGVRVLRRLWREPPRTG